MSKVDLPAPDLGELLANDDYVRRRIRPHLRDPDYLVLKDLYALVVHLARQAKGRVFDYGSGAAPYRGLFQHCDEYVAADVTPGPNIDRQLGPDGLTSEPSESYDVVLSTQVLEHVADPDVYLRECCRILKPGGQVILSTHGMVEEHGCPNDFYRWTSRGLEHLMEEHGLKVVESVKFTTEIRAIVQLLHQFNEHLKRSDRVLWRYSLAVVRRLYRRLAVPVLNWVAERFPGQGTVPGSDPSSLYVGVCVRAVKSRA